MDCKSKNEQALNYRHELKFEISYEEYYLLKSRLSPVMKLDQHANAQGIYEIFSLYFDNYKDKALWEKLDGVQKRDKYRLRYYDGNLSRISLEKKSKHNSLCLKKSCSITKDECRCLLDGDAEWIKRRENSNQEEENLLLREFYGAYISGQVRPKTIVSYKRQAFIYAPGNVRITFDMEIRSGLYHRDFLEVGYPLMPVLPGKMIMEVKYDEYLPDIIRLLIQSRFVRAGAFSKYASCRSYE